jgi:hypothetical protein
MSKSLKKADQSPGINESLTEIIPTFSIVEATSGLEMSKRPPLLTFKEHGTKSDGENGSRGAEDKVSLHRSGSGIKLDQDKKSDSFPG